MNASLMRATIGELVSTRAAEDFEVDEYNDWRTRDSEKAGE